jgi:hypothetical protein
MVRSLFGVDVPHQHDPTEVSFPGPNRQAENIMLA